MLERHAASRRSPLVAEEACRNPVQRAPGNHSSNPRKFTISEQIPKEIFRMAEILDVTDTNFDAEVLKSETPVIVDFWAEWCQPCRQIAPIIKTLADDYAGRVKVVKVNVDDSQHVAGNFGIRSIPAVLSFRDGQVVDQLVGVRPKANFVEMAEKIV
jgi:thioredoxin 1